MLKYRFVGSVVALLVLCALAVPTTESAGANPAMADDAGPIVGGIQDSPVGQENDLHVLELARFAVHEHNSKTNSLLEFEKIVKVREQVVAGTMYYITIEVNEGGTKKLYEAKVWEKLWENLKELKEFKPAESSADA